MLYLCIIPNHGARIGHQTHEYFVFNAYCKKFNFNYVYHPFIGNSKSFEKILNFKNLHNFCFENIKNIDNIEIINLETIKNDLHNNLLNCHLSEKNICVFGPVCTNEEIMKSIDAQINLNDIIEIKKYHRTELCGKYPNLVSINKNHEYMCIHIRAGDIINSESRYLDINYFIDKYNYLIKKINKEKQYSVYIITENNFTGDKLIMENIPDAHIIKCNEIDAFYYLVNSKYLIASRSGFSNLAYILGDMQVIKSPSDWNVYWDNIIE